MTDEELISIHALREEGDGQELRLLTDEQKFLSTPSARRATRADAGLVVQVKISIHALREEGDRPLCTKPSHRGISIHALREEGDIERQERLNDLMGFLSTPSARRATDGKMCNFKRA